MLLIRTLCKQSKELKKIDKMQNLSFFDDKKKTFDVKSKVNLENDKHYPVIRSVILLMRFYTTNIWCQFRMTLNKIPVKQGLNILDIPGNKACYNMQIKSRNFPCCIVPV